VGGYGVTLDDPCGDGCAVVVAQMVGCGSRIDGLGEREFPGVARDGLRREKRAAQGVITRRMIVITKKLVLTN
jgi:hypothetical protein